MAERDKQIQAIQNKIRGERAEEGPKKAREGQESQFFDKYGRPKMDD